MCPAIDRELKEAQPNTKLICLIYFDLSSNLVLSQPGFDDQVHQ